MGQVRPGGVAFRSVLISVQLPIVQDSTMQRHRIVQKLHAAPRKIARRTAKNSGSRLLELPRREEGALAQPRSRIQHRGRGAVRLEIPGSSAPQILSV
jgi:hypothetical protein